MLKALVVVFLSVPVTIVAQPNVIASYPVTLHQRLTASCELIRAATLTEYKEFDALTLAGATDEIYSPELLKGDSVGLSTALPKNVVKAAKKSGFDIRTESTDDLGQNTKAIAKGNSCPDVQQAIADTDHHRHQRRADLQAGLRQVGFGVSPPVPIHQEKPRSTAEKESAQSTGKPKVNNGTTILTLTVGIEGNVHDVHVTQSLDTVLDQKAIEAVQQWKFLPARMHGLPVPVEISVDVDFHLN